MYERAHKVYVYGVKQGPLPWNVQPYYVSHALRLVLHTNPTPTRVGRLLCTYVRSFIPCIGINKLDRYAMVHARACQILGHVPHSLGTFIHTQPPIRTSSGRIAVDVSTSHGYRLRACTRSYGLLWGSPNKPAYTQTHTQETTSCHVTSGDRDRRQADGTMRQVFTPFSTAIGLQKVQSWMCVEPLSTKILLHFQPHRDINVCVRLNIYQTSFWHMKCACLRLLSISTVEEQQHATQYYVGNISVILFHSPP